MEPLYADVIVDISRENLDRPFSYLVPEEMRSRISVGSVVQVPFGKGSRTVRGYVVGLSESTSCDPEKLKYVEQILASWGQERELTPDAPEDPAPDQPLPLTPEDRLVALAVWMRETYGATMAQALRTVIPVKRKVQQKVRKRLKLLLNEEEAEEKLRLYAKKNQRARFRLLEALLQEKELPWELASAKLNITSPVIRALEDQGVLEVSSETVYRTPLHHPQEIKGAVQLSEDQRRIVEGIRADREHQVSLIFGVTGSGKTEVYMELIDGVIRQGKQAIVLIPEIALTYQTVIRFYRRFGERISMIHSRLSAGEKYDQFQRAKRGELDIMIGPRSALFTPFPNLGLIILDEEHEPSYQSESMPRYHARETAIARAGLEGARVVLGSATPSLEAFSRAQSGVYALYRLNRRISGRALPEVSVVDMRRELRRGNRSVLSEALSEQITRRLEQREQVMLFLNRRGYSGFLSCRMCGHVLMCPHCDVSLSLHKNGRMVCHYCGHQEQRPLRCPKCGSEFLGSFGIGTQQVEELIKKQFPSARVLRMDLDTTREKDGHEKILAAFANQEADILIGTQMIVKGHDFPNVTLVGILAADLSLHADDYRAGERTFQLLTQAAGRAGRGNVPGEVVIQTYDPEHYCIRTAARQDYPAFYEEEMGYREIAGYPPARFMMSLHGAGRQEEHLQTAMEYLKKMILRMPEEQQVQIFGPVPERIAKIQDEYRKVIYLKAENMLVLTGIKNKLEKYMEINEGYRTVTIQFDRNE